MNGWGTTIVSSRWRGGLSASLRTCACSRFMAHRTGMTYASGIPQEVLRTTGWCQIGELYRKNGMAFT